MRTYTFTISTRHDDDGAQLRIVNGKAVKKPMFEIAWSHCDEIEQVSTRVVTGRKRGKTYTVERYIGTLY